MVCVSRLPSLQARFIKPQEEPACKTEGKGGSRGSGRGSKVLLGDAPRPPMFPPIFLRHLCIFLLIVASPRWSALAAPIPESDDHVT